MSEALNFQEVVYISFGLPVVVAVAAFMLFMIFLIFVRIFSVRVALNVWSKFRETR